MRPGAKPDDLRGVFWLGAPDLHPSTSRRSAVLPGSARYVVLAA